MGCTRGGWLATQSSIPPPPPHPLIRPAGLRIEFHLFCISQGFPAPALIPIITCKYFEISAENKTGLISEIYPRLNSDKKFTKITEFGKSATKIAKITKFYKAINKKRRGNGNKAQKSPNERKTKQKLRKTTKI